MYFGPEFVRYQPTVTGRRWWTAVPIVPGAERGYTSGPLPRPTLHCIWVPSLRLNVAHIQGRSPLPLDPL